MPKVDTAGDGATFDRALGRALPFSVARATSRPVQGEVLVRGT